MNSPHSRWNQVSLFLYSISDFKLFCYDFLFVKQIICSYIESVEECSIYQWLQMMFTILCRVGIEIKIWHRRKTKRIFARQVHFEINIKID